LIFSHLRDTIIFKEKEGKAMAVSYKRLFHLMIDKGMTNAELMEKGGFSANIITRLKRNNYVALDSIEKICYALDCGVDDILEFIPDEKEQENHD
jgi:DNA-binding Xre family transcriptional regulator